MNLNPRYWFQKRTSSFGAAATETQNRMRYNALFALDPDVMVRHIAAFAAGDIAGLERVIDEFESRDDKMKIGAFKMSAAVASKPWEVRIVKGEEENERAKLHRDVLTRFWNRVEATDAFCRNRRGGVRMLVKQMMSAQSRVYACHDIAWNVRGDGELEALFTFVPAWMFENRTGELRFLREPGAYTGEPMKDGEWLVTVGEGVGISAAILAMSKRLSWNDWLLFSEKCGMPVIIGNTNAKEDTPAWNALLRAIRAIAPKTGILADMESKLQAVQIGGSSGQSTYHELIETVDRAISSLYRGGDLATMSSTQGEGTGSDSQDGESEIMDGDGCTLVSETLHRQIDRHVIRFTCGDFEPLAGIVINPPAEVNDIDRDMKIDQHLGEFGVKLSKKDMLTRYGRTEAADESDAAIRQIAQQAGFGGLANELNKGGRADPPDGRAGAHSSSNFASRSDLRSADMRTPTNSALLAAFAKDTSAAGKAVAELLQNQTPEAAKALLDRLPSLLPDDPEMASVIAEAMAAEFGVMLANENPYHCPKCGKFSGFNGHCDKCGYTLDAGETEKRAERLLNKSLDDAMFKPVQGIAYRDGLGQIDLDVGKKGEGKGMEHGNGISKIDQKHRDMISHLPRTLAQGKIYRVRPGNDPSKPFDDTQRAIVHGNISIFLSEKRKGVWKIDSIYDDVKKVEKIERAAAV